MFSYFLHVHPLLYHLEPTVDLSPLLKAVYIPVLADSRVNPEKFLGRGNDARMGQSSVAAAAPVVPGKSWSDSTELDALADVFQLRNKDKLDKFNEIWYYIFLWGLFSSIFVHTFAALIAFCKLHQHKYGRFYPVLMILMGVISPLTGGACTSAVIALLYVAAKWSMPTMVAMVCGVAQTALLIAVSVSRILATL